jgi:hypothetical protein
MGKTVSDLFDLRQDSFLLGSGQTGSRASGTALLYVSCGTPRKSVEIHRRNRHGVQPGQETGPGIRPDIVLLDKQGSPNILLFVGAGEEKFEIPV